MNILIACPYCNDTDTQIIDTNEFEIHLCYNCKMTFPVEMK